MLGEKSKYAPECRENGYIYANYGINTDLTNELPEDWTEFNNKWRPYLVSQGKTPVGAGLSCGALWTICKGILIGDIIFSPDGKGNYYVGEVIGDYEYHPNIETAHRRKVQWYTNTVKRSDMSLELRNSTGSTGTTCEITKYREELEVLIGGGPTKNILSSTDKSIENPTSFALEKHLEDFLVRNWNNTIFAQNYDILRENGEIVGQQFPSDTGPIDILAISKDEKEYLVIELKKGRASDNVVGQILRYMGYLQESYCTPNQTVKGVIIALEDDLRIRRALAVTNNIDFYSYQINFELHKQ